MDRFLIITNKEKDSGFNITNQIVDYIKRAGKTAILSSVSTVQALTDEVIGEGFFDCAIVLGGDGTIIQTAYDLMTHDIPMLGVNLGTLGFLAEIEKHNVFEALDRLFNDDYQIEKRIMLEGEIARNQNKQTDNIEVFTALNDAVITRKGFSRIISLHIYVNDTLVDMFKGDGVIISTPTGSTAYNLSAGGPIVTQGAAVMVITPICPHSLSPRSVVVSADDTIRIVIGRSKKTQEAEASISFDGKNEIDLGTDDAVIIKRSRHSTKLVRLNRSGIYEVLRSKLESCGD